MSFLHACSTFYMYVLEFDPERKCRKKRNKIKLLVFFLLLLSRSTQLGGNFTMEKSNPALQLIFCSWRLQGVTFLNNVLVQQECTMF